MKLTPRIRIAAGIVLVVAGFAVGFAELFRMAGYLSGPTVAVALALNIAGLAVLLFRRSEAPIATGIALVLVAPLVWFMLLLTPIKGVPVSYLVAGAIALYGIFLIALELAETRRKEAD